jgi:hypothetical protein
MENPLSVGMIIPYINIYEMENQKKRSKAPTSDRLFIQAGHVVSIPCCRRISLGFRGDQRTGWIQKTPLKPVVYPFQ